ncbi:MAG: hypothetical protein KAG66_14230, partial [Methylococcales bacterium]|nr:hypothetical protein [Methylococcales bacterium]
LLWNDHNADGIYQADGIDGIAGNDDDEAPIEGVTIDLYRDLNGNGLIDADEPLIAQTTTSGTLSNTSGDAGNYLFDGLPGGDYVVQVSDDDGVLNGYWHSEGTANTTDNSQSSAYAVTLADGGEDVTADFGYYTGSGAIGNRIWEDLDGDRLYDAATEPGIADVTVILTIEYPDGSVQILKTQTAADGTYSFGNLLLDEDYNGISASNYGAGGDEPKHTISLDLSTVPTGLLSIYSANTDSTTVGGTAADDELTDVGADNPTGEQAYPPMGGVDNTNDFGYTPSASIGNRVWLDFDGDGNQDANEDGIANILVELWADTTGDGSSDTLLTTTTTGPDGEYNFPGLMPGVAYETRIPTPPAGLIHSYDEDGNLDSQSGVITLTPGEEHETADFGYTPPVGSIGDTVWIDSDGDGEQDPGEPGIPGITVELIDNDGNVLDTQTTDSNGHYLFTGLTEGVYTVRVTPPAGYDAHPEGDPDVRDGIGSEADNLTTVTLVNTGGTVESNLDADFGYVPPVSNSNTVGDTVYFDLNGDGSEQLGEPAAAGVTMTLFVDSNGDGVYQSGEPAVATQLTDSDGHYLFTGLPDGNYLVKVTDTDNVLANTTQTADPDATLDSTSAVDLDSAGVSAASIVDLDQDFGYKP